MTKAEEICQDVKKDIKPQAITLANAVLTMQEKIEDQIPIYAQMPLAQMVKVGTGETMLRGNPAVQEFRAMVKDYAHALNDLHSILENNSIPKNMVSIEELRNEFKLKKVET